MRPTIATINDIQNLVQSSLPALRNLPLNEEITSALKYVTPEGYSLVVKIEGKDGKKRRRDAAASYWTPEDCTIHISYKKESGQVDKPAVESAPAVTPAITSKPSSQPATGSHSFRPIQLPSIEPVSVTEVAQCCQALDQAEKLGRHFIALKWFRDSFLTEQRFPWTLSDQRRQQVLSHAIETGRIQSKKIPNPRSPQFPTTTIVLNRVIETPTIAPRFQPVPVRGEPVSSTLIRDRGTF